MIFTPVALFVYARLSHTQSTVEALLNNPGAELTDLIIFSDAARTIENQENVEEVRAYLKSINGFRSINIYERPYNFGLAKSIIEGVTEVLKKHDAVIVLEDDLVTSPYFLKFMNEALEKYAEDDRVISIHGYVLPVNQSLPETFFLRGADCWGWATWRRGWKNFNPDGQHLLDELNRRKLIGTFDFNGAYSFSKMLKAQIKGINDSWAVRWHASAFLANKLTLYPGRSLVHNIGHDGSGTHCGEGMGYDQSVSLSPIVLANIEVQSCAQGQAVFEAFFRKDKRSFISKLLRRTKKTLAKVIA
jgi:hypothetical protein